MKKSILTLSATILLIVASCSKKNEEPTDETVITCLQTIAKFDDGAKFEFTYDDKGRVTAWKQYWVGSDVETFTYQYLANEIIETQNGTYKDITRHTLDATGKITSSTTTYGYDSSTSTTSYSYDANGYLTQIKSGTETVNMTYTNGNVMSINDGYRTYSITYGTETFSGTFSRYNTNDTFPEELETPLSSYFGKRSKVLPVKSVIKEGSNTTTESYTYEKDANGNVVKFINSVDYSSGTDYVDTNLYTHSCK